jgi:hypothetical protein
MLGGFILIDFTLYSYFPEKKNVFQLVFALFSLLVFLFLITFFIKRKK